MSNRSFVKTTLSAAVIAATTLVGMTSAANAEGVLDVYSARKENLIKPLLDKFTEETGITVNLLTGKYGDIQKRLEVEGAESPADVYITVDAGRLHNAKAAGLLQSFESDYIDQNLPANLRDTDKQWVGLSYRARPAYVVKGKVDTGLLQTYEDLTRDEFKGRVCIRSSSNIYNQSLVASLIEHEGEEKAQAWAEGIVANMARPPSGGDTDQLRAAAAGECDIAVANHYYYARLMNSDKPSDVAVSDALDIVWLNQDDRGNHVNVSGAGLTKSSDNKAQAVQLIEFLLSAEAQHWYADVNNEFPVITGAEVPEKMTALGEFKADTLDLSKLGENNRKAVELMDRAGWQ